MTRAERAAERDGPHWRAWRAYRREAQRRWKLRFKKPDLQRGEDVRWMLLEGTGGEWGAWARAHEGGVEGQVARALTRPWPEVAVHYGRRVPACPRLEDYDRWRFDHGRRQALVFEWPDDGGPWMPHGPLRRGRRRVRA